MEVFVISMAIIVFITCYSIVDISYTLSNMESNQRRSYTNEAYEKFIEANKGYTVRIDESGNVEILEDNNGSNT